MEFEYEQIDEYISCQDFQHKVLNNPKPCILEFYASWCPPCKDLELKKQEVLPPTTKRKGQWQWFKIDADEDEDFIEKQNLAGIPTVILYNQGQELQRFVGLDLKEFQQMMNNISQLIQQSQ